MNDIIYSLLREWPALDSELDIQLRGLPDYAVRKARLDAAAAELEEALGDDRDQVLLRYEDAESAMHTLCSDAAFLCGFRFCARLLTEIFTS